MLASIDADANRDSVKLGPVGNAIRGLRQCRSAKAQQIAMNVENKRISKADGISQINQLKQQNLQDGELIKAVLGKADDRVNSYVQARASTMNPGNPQVAVQTLTSSRNRASNSTSKASQSIKLAHNISDESNATTTKDLDKAAATITAMM